MSDLHESGWVRGSAPLLNHYAAFSSPNNNKTTVIVEVEVALVVVFTLLFVYYNSVYCSYRP